MAWMSTGRRIIHQAMSVCKERGYLLLNEEVKVVCEDQRATDWINSFFSSTNFMNAAMATRVYVAAPDGTVGFKLVKYPRGNSQWHTSSLGMACWSPPAVWGRGSVAAPLPMARSNPR